MPNARVAVPAVRPPPQVGRRAGWAGGGGIGGRTNALCCAALSLHCRRCWVANARPSSGPRRVSSPRPHWWCAVCSTAARWNHPPAQARGEARHRTVLNYLQYPKGATTNWIGVANVNGISSGSEGSSGVAGPRWSLSSTPPVVALRLYLVLSGSVVRVATRPACVAVGRVAWGAAPESNTRAGRARVGPPSRARRRQVLACFAGLLVAGRAPWEKRREGEGARLGWAVAGACVFLLSKAWRCRDFDCERTAQPKVQGGGG